MPTLQESLLKALGPKRIALDKVKAKTQSHNQAPRPAQARRAEIATHTPARPSLDQQWNGSHPLGMIGLDAKLEPITHIPNARRRPKRT